LIATLQGDESTCSSTKDQDGQACEWCALSSINICVTAEQAELAEQVGADCKTPAKIEVEALEDVEEANLVSPYDTTCLMASLDRDESSCTSTSDKDGDPCQWCPVSSVGLCLTMEQVDLANQVGINCNSEMELEDEEDDMLGMEEEFSLDFPDDFFKCLTKSKHSERCSDASCTVCTLECGSTICLSDAAAEAVKDCSFLDCSENALTRSSVDDSPLDPQCLAAGMGSEDAESTCESTSDGDGNPCVWCDAAGVFRLCMSTEQASFANQWLDCNSSPVISTH